MDAIAREFGNEAVQHILQQCNEQEGSAASDAENQMAGAVTSDSDNNASPIWSSNDDE